MVATSGSRSQEQSGGSSNSQVTEGCRVAVLNGRHFPAFGAGDEGVVTKLTAESQNCEVRFDGRPKPVPVALRHLRVISPPSRNSPQKSSPQKVKLENAHTSNGYSDPSNDAKCRVCGNVCMADAIFCRHCGERRAQDTHCPSCGNVYMADANFCRHCGEKRAEVRQGDTGDTSREQWSGLTSLLNAEAPSMEHCEYMDSTEGFAAGLAAVSGAATNGVSNFSDRKDAVHPFVMDAGHGKHTHSAPEFSQASPEATGAFATLPMYSPRGTQYTPRTLIGSGTGPAGRQSPRVSGAHVAQMTDDLSCSCAEVASLRHALTQCVGAMGTCANAIESMCLLQGGMQLQHPEALVGWRSAAMALRDAADLGSKALQTPSSMHHGVSAASKSAGAEAPSQLAQCGSLQRIGSATSLTPVSVEVLAAGTGVPSTYCPSGCMDTQRRFLVASPARPAQPASLHPASLGGMPLVQHLPQFQPPPLGGGVGFVGMGTAPSAVGQHPMPSVLGSPGGQLTMPSVLGSPGGQHHMPSVLGSPGGQHSMPSMLGSPPQLQPPAGLCIQGFSPLGGAIAPLP
eukprot:TRINITY_DN3856_c0_g1_i1.p1 TRINITY_DN3856_c0_g1~~TRINITY_DN3856_c0_g1_i1.p1  ORF type:complete len:569 (-),score=106.49 TRINITY_DN3856_c0_g1_i1:213-1919(-)